MPPTEKVNVAVPWLTPVTIPLLLMVATSGLLLVHTPPEDGLKEVVEPTQIEAGPVRRMTGLLPIITAADESDLHPVIESMYINLDAPPARPRITPSLVTEATPGEPATHVPPEIGNKKDWAPIQMEVEPVISISGLGITLITAVAVAEQPCVLVT